MNSCVLFLLPYSAAAMAAGGVSAGPATAIGSASQIGSVLVQLAELKSQGLLDEHEFKAAKAKLLAR
jgi:hypothetical protein